MPSDGAPAWRLTGRRIRGPITDLVELTDPEGAAIAVVYAEDWSDDPALALPSSLDDPGVAGIAPCIDAAPGVRVYACLLYTSDAADE